MNMYIPGGMRLRAGTLALCLLALMLTPTILCVSATTNAVEILDVPVSVNAAGELAQQEGKPRNQMRTRRAEPNVLAPELYMEHLKLKMTLVDLPGASDPKSYWEGTYQLYFVSEADHNRALEEAVKLASGPKGGAVGINLDLAQFPAKVLLAEGSFKKSGLASLKDRTFMLDRIAFRAKVPEAARTKEARLLLSCSVKIFDARLKQTIFRTRLWDAQAPMMQDAAQPERDVTRTTVYSNFYVTKTGDVYESQWTREGEDTSW
ncbi:MAG TPA: hypothetical protein VGC66_13365 [Pyrinomonadaceae bacterium]|jgi:hypothetical protein